MDHIAFALGADPLAVRRANFYAAMADNADASGGSISAKKKPQTTPYHMPVEDFIGQDLVAELEQTRRLCRAAGRDCGMECSLSPILKRGIALTPVKFGISFTLTQLNQAGALVHVYQDGSIHLNHGGTEMGQGLFQKVAQVAAGVFGVDPAVVKITATDTGKVPNTSATAASSRVDLNGMATQAACETIRARMAAHLAAKHQADPADVHLCQGARARCRRGLQLCRSGAVGLSGADFAVIDRVLCHAENHLGPGQGRRPPLPLLRLWRGGDRSGDRHADRRKPHSARRYSA